MEYFTYTCRQIIYTLLVLTFFYSVESSSMDLIQKVIEIDNHKYKIKLPKGYVLELLTDDMDSPRMFSFDQNGILFIGSKSGNVYRLEPPYDKPSVFTFMDNYPHSISFKDRSIYIAETDAIKKADYHSELTSIKPENFSVVTDLPGGGGHSSRTIARGPDNKLYVSLGITGNCSNEFMSKQYAFQNRRGGVFVLDESIAPSKLNIFASGLRNPVGFDWHPDTHIMYASNNGPDHHGFENPPEYFSEITKNSFHGMPWYQFSGKKMFRDNCIKSKPPFDISEAQIPVVTFPARNAPMGVSFIADGSALKDITQGAVVALRGSWATKPSWNYKTAAASRRKPKLVIVHFDKGHQVTGVSNLLTGFQLENGNRWARPVGVGTGPDGALYFTSDSGVNGLFRIRKINE